MRKFDWMYQYNKEKSKQRKEWMLKLETVFAYDLNNYLDDDYVKVEAYV